MELIKKAIRNIIICIKTTIIDIKKGIKNIIIWAFLTAIAIGGVTYFVNIPIEYDANAMTKQQ